jgi:hypothetical protein
VSDQAQVFISHVHEERHVALVLQKYIRQAFRDAFPVFAAFDKESIGGGKKWFTHVVENLKRSLVVFVLVSGASRRRPWLAFEAGVGDGVDATVIPVGIRNFAWGRLEFPLFGYQGRSIDDLPSILSDITKAFKIPSEAMDHDAYLGEIRTAEASMAYKSVTVRPFVHHENFTVRFEIENRGNTDIELLMLEVWMPVECLYEPWGRRPAEQFVTTHMHVEVKWRDAREYRWFACTSNRGAFGSKPWSLRPIITPAMGVTSVLGMDILLNRNLPRDSSEDWPIYFQIHAVDYPTEPDKITWQDLWTDSR